jgi:hypothetical protein
MRGPEADEIINMVNSNWNMNLEAGAKMLWKSYLMKQDVQVTMKAVTKLAKESHFKPSLADLVECIDMFSTASGRALPESTCKTCEGLGFVLVGTRAPKQTGWMEEKGITISGERGEMEEYACCPDCGTHMDSSFYRYDGTKAEALDPQRVRELMSQ